MKPSAIRNTRRHELLREFFACAVVLAAIKAAEPDASASSAAVKSPYTRS